MELKGKDYFSPKYEFRKLRKNPGLILDAFKDRIEGWYFKPIETLLKNPQNDFVVVAIECMLIDALSGYRYGTKGDTDRETYARFLKESIKCDDFTAREFYRRFRCGILHETRIKKRSYIARRRIRRIKYEGDRLFLNPVGLYKVLRKYFYEYLESLKRNKELMNNFAKRFDYLFKEEIGVSLFSLVQI